MSLFRRAVRGMRRVVGRYPALYLPWIRARRKVLDKAVTSDTEIVIEGFPRSGNSFEVAAFRLAQPGEPRIAHQLFADDIEELGTMFDVDLSAWR